MIRCFLGISLFATLLSAGPQITLTTTGNPVGETEFAVVTVSSSPSATVMLTFTDSWIKFEAASSTGCRTTSATAIVSTPASLKACLSNTPTGGTFYTFITATARGFPATTASVPITVFPGGNVQILRNPNTISLGQMLTVPVKETSSTDTFQNLNGQPRPLNPASAASWLLENDNCQQRNTGSGISCTATVSVNPNAQGLNPGQQYSAEVQFLDTGGSRGGISVTYTHTPASVISPALNFVPVTPCRVVDTRNPNGTFGGPMMGSGSTRDFPVRGICGIPATALAYALNVTVAPAPVLGYLSIWPSGQQKPVVSTLNSTDGRTKANAAIVPAGANGAVTVYVSDATHVILDINGYFVSPTVNPSALSFYPLPPCRIADTRPSSGTGPLGSPFLSSADAKRDFPILLSACGIPTTAQAYSLNFTAIPPSGIPPGGYITVWPTGQTVPGVSTLNFAANVVTANAAIVPAGSMGDISIYAKQNTDLIIDVNGYFAPSGKGGLSLYNLVPCRVLETRAPAGSPPNPPITGQNDVSVVANTCGVPGGAQAYVMNATVVPPSALEYLTLWPKGGMQPGVSTLNAYNGAVTSNMAIVPAANDSISTYVTHPTHLLLDISGYFAP